ncbi:MAG: TIGR01212 family radical SAM protein [Acetatifactor sp.]|nr:TIGR01212 family radical SAM protein [Acetatifactor sp.]
MRQSEWHGKPYYSLDAWCKNTLSRKCYKIALNAHMTCPNRDGTLGTQGCIFCSAGGSGDFAVDNAEKSMDTQLSEGLARLHAKFSPDKSACLIAYFQAYTNTYAPVSYLRQIYTEALSCPWVCGISIATRPDCLPHEVIRLLTELRELYPDKFIWIELGLQTIHEQTAAFIRRGYTLSCFEEAFARLTEADIPVIVHLILGLPGETSDMMLQSVRYLNPFRPFGVKLQLLHILRDTDLGTLYLAQQSDPAASPGPFALRPLELDEYLDILIACIRNLSPEIVIHRLTGDGPRKDLLAPLWSLDKRNVLNTLHRQMRTLNAIQGDLYHNI